MSAKRQLVLAKLGRAAAVVGAVIWLASGCVSYQGSNGDPRITRILSAVRGKYCLPAMSAAIITSEGLQQVGVTGTRKMGTAVPATLDDLWHLGSDTKIITASLLSVLVDQGRLRWTTSLSEVFPELAASFDPDFREVNLLQLLSHRAGLPANLDWQALAKSGTVQNQRLEAVKIALSAKPLSRPGSQFLYSNLGYVLVGAVIERATGVSWEQAIGDIIFKPLGMASAGFGGVGTVGLIDQPWGHSSRGVAVGINGPLADNPPVLGPAGTVHCSIQDWAKFVADQLRGARGLPGLLSPQAYHTLQTPHFGDEYALGWGVVDRPWAGGKALNHSGSNTMYFCVAWVAPARDLAILICTNQGLDAFPAVDEAVGQIIGLIAQKGNESGE